jgi:hypothetical protein
LWVVGLGRNGQPERGDIQGTGDIFDDSFSIGFRQFFVKYCD